MSASDQPGRTPNRLPAIVMSFVFALIVLGPIAWALATSFKSEIEAVSIPPTLIPNVFTFQNYLKVFTDQSFIKDLLNSLSYSIGAVALSLVVGIPAGYAYVSYIGHVNGSRGRVIGSHLLFA